MTVYGLMGDGVYQQLLLSAQLLINFYFCLQDILKLVRMGKSRRSTGSNSQKTRVKEKVLIDDTLYTESDISLSMDASFNSIKPTPIEMGKQEEITKQEESQQDGPEYDEGDSIWKTQTKEQDPAQNKIQENDQNREKIRSIMPSLSEELSQPDYNNFLKHGSARADLSLLSTQHDNEQDEYNFIDSQLLQKRMKEIDDCVRSLSMQKNRLKYLLRKKEGLQVDGQQEPMPMKQCKCCNKDISKLCFRCEHIYCKPDQCARKKKQVLNARMLRKLKENKQSGNGKKSQLKSKKQRKGMGMKMEELPEVMEESSMDSDQSSTQPSSDQLADYNMNHPLPMKKEEEEQEYPSVDISASSFFTLTSEKSNIFFDPNEQ